MIKHILTATALSAGLLMAAPAQADPVYLIANVTVDDFNAYMGNYGSVAIPTILEAGGEILVATPETTVIEGEYTHNWTVVVRFPNAEAANGWYHSSEYQAVIPARHAASNTDTSVMLFADEFVPPAPPAD